MTSDVIVIGGGAAGLFCAATAGARGKNVVLIEHNATPGRKIRISGGGRCNFTNINTTPANFLSQNQHFTRSALARYTPQDFINLVDRYGIRWHEKTLGQLFCDDSAQQIIDMLVKECDNAGVAIATHTAVTSVQKIEGGFAVETSKGTWQGETVVVASGGLSIPKLGASDVGYRIAKTFGVPMVQTAPALVPVVCSKTWLQRWGSLAGVSADVSLSVGDALFRENILFTHKGLTGPAILQGSSYLPDEVQQGMISIDLLPDHSTSTLFPTPNREPRSAANVISDVLAKRLVQAWTQHDLNRRVDQLSLVELDAIVDAFKNWLVKPLNTEGYLKAEVTRGGIDTNALSSKTMECKDTPGLYFIGEVVDVTGWLGGYNFQWAWSSGYAAGMCV